MSRLQEIRDRAVAATPGPWHWSGNTDTRNIALAHWRAGHGRCNVMDFARWGMQSATPRFARAGDIFMDPAHEQVVYEVANDATRRTDPRVYRADIVGIRHPDAAFIAHSRQDVSDLVAIIDKVRAHAERWLDDFENLTDDECIEGPECPCCTARDILSILGDNRPAVRPMVQTVQVVGDVL